MVMRIGKSSMSVFYISINARAHSSTSCKNTMRSGKVKTIIGNK